ncbi:hypothetical protein [Halorussus amylolyticus]|uniref:hypothetical protein n=1 Tax=Halorussus amylolyticus TaxID=1126242 RepID=UPI001052701C|nr:hypothetical protein [Halorussus amylolyticus]
MADWNTDSTRSPTERGSRAQRDPRGPGRPHVPRRLSAPRTEAAFAIGGGAVAVNSSLYFFGVEALSHPVLTVVGVALLAALYVEIE